MAGLKIGSFTEGEDDQIAGYWADGHKNRHRFAQAVSREMKRPINPYAVEHLWHRPISKSEEWTELVDKGEEGGFPITIFRSG